MIKNCLYKLSLFGSSQFIDVVTFSMGIDVRCTNALDTARMAESALWYKDNPDVCK